ncbi:MAG: hypothetical protein IJK84_03880 [Bacteroidales bacterium]|nr:hypothetical protein [Bacteroidales bacterium]
MKRIVVLLLILLLSQMPLHAQWGSLIQKAATKTAKTIEKKADSVANAASAALDRQVEKRLQARQAASDNQQESAENSYGALMRQMPDLPTVQQLCSHKEAELNEQTLRLLSSAVTRFNTHVLNLSVKVSAMAVRNIDSSNTSDFAYKMAQLTTGMSREEIDHLASLPEEEQEAYLAAHYKNGTAEAALVEQAAEANKYLEPLQPLIDKWDEVGRKADQVLEQADTKCKKIYKKFASQLESATGKERNKVLLEYYSNIVAVQRDAVQQAMKIRLEEQLPIAEEIEAKMVKIREEHKDAISSLLNYPQLTASQYFAEWSRLLDIPEYK